MSYLRVIPRDLFNEANLLKCYGQLYIQLEKIGLEHTLEHSDTNEQFMVEQTIDGDLRLKNVQLLVNGGAVHLFRPVNSREPYPLYALEEDTEEEISIFKDDGSFTEEMIVFLTDADRGKA
jgi:hypothetical protein